MWDFLKQAVVEKLEDVPEQFRALYVQDDATKKFVIAPGAKALVDSYVGTTAALNKAVKDLATANNEAASRRVTASAVVDFAKKLGLENIDEANPLSNIETHIGELLGKVKGGSDLKVNLENIKKDYEVKNKALADAAAAQIATMQSSLDKHMIGGTTLAALTKHGGNPAFLTDIVAKRAKVVKDENGEYSVRIMDDAGSPRANGAGGWLDIDGYVGELKSNATFAAAFASTANGGTGHKPGASGSQVPLKKDGEKSSMDKINAGLRAGKYQRGNNAAA